MSSAIGNAKTLFVDQFDRNGKIDSSKWNFNEYAKGGSFYGNTQQRQELPSAKNGNLQLRLDTYNPTNGDPDHPTFLGSEAITERMFNVGDGIAFEARARMVQDQRGIIGGFFTLGGDVNNHDEIDFEAITNKKNAIQTNIYHNEGYGEGHPQSHPFKPASTLTEFHDYRIEWLPNMVRWLVDGEVVRQEKSAALVPDKAMAMHLNIWGPPSSWATGDSSLKAVNSAAQNQTFLFEFDSVKVSQLATSLGGRSSDALLGSKAADWMVGMAGADKLIGGDGDDNQFGGAGADLLRGGKGADYLSGGVDDDRLYGGAQPDDLRGGKGDDTLVGGGGDDTMRGGLGDDVLIGAHGADEVYGDEGADTFLYRALTDSPVDAHDTLMDMDPEFGDQIDLSAIDADHGTAGNQAFEFIGTAAFTGTAGEVRTEADGDDLMVLADVDGDQTADLAILVRDLTALTESDFIL